MDKTEYINYDNNTINFKTERLGFNFSFNGNSFEDFAIIGIIVRLNDKINRIANLSKSNSKKVIIDESVEDTINDLYNYCIIGLMFG